MSDISAKKALFWASVVELLLISLYIAFCAVDTHCGFNGDCAKLYARRASFVGVNLVLALIGLRLARHRHRGRCFALFTFLCFGTAVIEAFVSVNYPWWYQDLLQPTYEANAALTAALGIISAVAYFLRHSSASDLAQPLSGGSSELEGELPTEDSAYAAEDGSINSAPSGSLIGPR